MIIETLFSKMMFTTNKNGLVPIFLTAHFFNICIGSQFSSEKNVFQRPETMPSKALEISSTVTLPFFSWCFSGTKDGTASTPQTSELRRILISLLLNLSYLSGCERKGLNVHAWIEVSPGRY